MTDDAQSHSLVLLLLRVFRLYCSELPIKYSAQILHLCFSFCAAHVFNFELKCQSAEMLQNEKGQRQEKAVDQIASVL